MAIAAATAFVGAVTASGPVEAAEKGAGHIRSSAGSAAVAEAAVQQSSEEALAAYTQARRALNYRDFQRAADLFRLARDGAPGSQLAVDAAYWEAFSLYRVGDVQAYRRALDVLEAQRHQASETGRDAEALYVRIRTELAMSGDPGAVAAITGSAGSNREQPDHGDVLDVRLRHEAAEDHQRRKQAVPAAHDGAANRHKRHHGHHRNMRGPGTCQEARHTPGEDQARERQKHDKRSVIPAGHAGQR
jgi:hypothetical protein